MEKMSTTKRLSVKAEKPQDQTCASQAQKLIDHILDDQTTGLSDALDSAVYNSVLLGNAAIKMEGGPITTAVGGPFTISTNTSNAVLRASASNPGWGSYPRPIDLKREMLETHPAFELTVEQLRAAWMLTYGNRWVSMDEASSDDYMEKVSMRLRSLGELEVHNVIDQYAPMARIKV
jgi:hypothetical protein